MFKKNAVKTDLICPRCLAHLATFREHQHYKMRLVDRDPMYFCPKCGWYRYESEMDLDEYTRKVES